MTPVSTGHTFRRRSKAIYASTLDTKRSRYRAPRRRARVAQIDLSRTGALSQTNVIRESQPDGRAGATDSRCATSIGQSRLRCARDHGRIRRVLPEVTVSLDTTSGAVAEGCGDHRHCQQVIWAIRSDHPDLFPVGDHRLYPSQLVRCRLVGGPGQAVMAASGRLRCGFRSPTCAAGKGAERWQRTRCSRHTGRVRTD